MQTVQTCQVTCYTTCHIPCLNCLNNSSNISFKMLYATQEHKYTNSKMADRRVAPAIISFLLLDDDEVKTRGKTRSWIKRRKQRGAFSNIIQELRMEDIASFKEML